VTAAGSGSAGRWSLDCAAFVRKTPAGGGVPGVQAQERCQHGAGPRLWVAGNEPTLLGMSLAGGTLVILDIDRHAAHAVLSLSPAPRVLLCLPFHISALSVTTSRADSSVMEVMHGLTLHRRCIVLRCTLPSHLRPPVYPLPLTAAKAPSLDTGLRAIARSIGAGALPINLPAQRDGKGCPLLPVRVRTTDGRHTDAKPQGGRAVPVLLRADGNSAAFVPLPLQARHRPCRFGGPMAAVSLCTSAQMHVRRLRLNPRWYGASMAADGSAAEHPSHAQPSSQTRAYKKCASGIHCGWLPRRM